MARGESRSQFQDAHCAGDVKRDAFRADSETGIFRKGCVARGQYVPTNIMLRIATIHWVDEGVVRFGNRDHTNPDLARQ